MVAWMLHHETTTDADMQRVLSLINYQHMKIKHTGIAQDTVKKNQQDPKNARERLYSYVLKDLHRRARKNTSLNTMI
jgi:hypothetical protein